MPLFLSEDQTGDILFELMIYRIRVQKISALSHRLRHGQIILNVPPREGKKPMGVLIWPVQAIQLLPIGVTFLSPKRHQELHSLRGKAKELPLQNNPDLNRASSQALSARVGTLPM